MARRDEGPNLAPGSRRDTRQSPGLVRHGDRLGGGAVMKHTTRTINWPLAARGSCGRGWGRIGILGLLTASLIASGCAQQKAAAPVELIPANLLEPKHHAVPQKDVLDQQPE